jgi:hypothetical protein
MTAIAMTGLVRGKPERSTSVAVPFSRVLVDEVAQFDRIKLYLQDNRFVGFNADHEQLQVLAAGPR